MRTEVAMPHMGMSMEEGKILTWLKPVGAKVERGEAIAEVETDKSTVVLEAPSGGTLIEVIVAQGAVAPVGAMLAVIDDGAPVAEDAASAPPLARPVAAALTPASAPVLTPAPMSRTGRVRATPLARRLALQRGIDLREVQGSGPEQTVGKAEVEAFLAQSEVQHTQPVEERVNASPVARRLADGWGIDLTRVKGSGPGGRIVKEDVEDVVATRPPVAAGGPTQTAADKVKRVPLSKIRLLAGRRMSESKAAAPHFYVSMDIEMSRALAFRDSLKARGVEISVNDLILRAATLALLKHPMLNAQFAGEEVHVFPHINLAVAVALDEGLVTPVVHNCESLSLTQLADAARTVIQNARAGRQRPQELEGGTFTVTNLGMFGVTHFHAIVNPPQAAILAVGTVRRVPAFDEHDRVVARQWLNATVSADHRVTDGAAVAQFMQEVKRILEDAFELL